MIRSSIDNLFISHNNKNATSKLISTHCAVTQSYMSQVLYTTIFRELLSRAIWADQKMGWYTSGRLVFSPQYKE